MRHQPTEKSKPTQTHEKSTKEQRNQPKEHTQKSKPTHTQEKSTQRTQRNQNPKHKPQSKTKEIK